MRIGRLVFSLIVLVAILSEIYNPSPAGRKWRSDYRIVLKTMVLTEVLPNAQDDRNLLLTFKEGDSTYSVRCVAPKRRYKAGESVVFTFIYWRLKTSKDERDWELYKLTVEGQKKSCSFWF